MLSQIYANFIIIQRYKFISIKEKKNNVISPLKCQRYKNFPKKLTSSLYRKLNILIYKLKILNNVFLL